MIRASLVSMAALLTFALSAPTAVAGPEAEALIGDAAERIAMGEYRAADLSALIDTERVARFTLGRHARTIDAQDLERYSGALETALHRAFQTGGAHLQSGQLDVVGSTDRNPRDSIVTTRIRVSGEAPLTVRWRVIERDGEWRVVDVEALGLWLAIEQRAQVSAILGQRGATIDDVISAFDRQVAKLETGATRG
ncbi:MAG: ABC transporter substrate-binding protein [Pseudomonadota bacterium]